MAPSNDAPSLYLIVEVDSPTEACARLEAALAVVPCHAVLLMPTSAQHLDVARARVLVELAQGRSIAALIAYDARLARTLGADGVHLGPSGDTAARYQAARGIVGGRAIVGADAGTSRHDAMTLGEAGADYVAFGVDVTASDQQVARAERHERCQWWSEIFEVPCVAFDASSLEEAVALAETGAEFLAIRLRAREPIVDMTTRLAAIRDAIAFREPVA